MFAAAKNQLSQNKFKTLRTRGFTIVSVLFILALLGAGSYKFLLAWIIRDPVEQIHLWHVSELAALTILLFGGTLIWLLVQPEEKPALAQFFIVGITILAVLFTPFVPQAPGLLVLLALFIVLYPNFRSLLSFSREGRVSKLLLGLSVVAAVVLLPNAWKEYQWQLAGWQYGEIHALDLHWVGSAVLTLLLDCRWLAGIDETYWLERSGYHCRRHLRLHGCDGNAYAGAGGKLGRCRWTLRHDCRCVVHHYHCARVTECRQAGSGNKC